MDNLTHAMATGLISSAISKPARPERRSTSLDELCQILIFSMAGVPLVAEPAFVDASVLYFDGTFVRIDVACDCGLDAVSRCFEVDALRGERDPRLGCLPMDVSDLDGFLSDVS